MSEDIVDTQVRGEPVEREDWFLTEDVDLANASISAKTCDVVSIVYRADGSQTLEGMDSIARDATLSETGDKGTSIWYNVAEEYAVGVYAGNTVVNYKTFADKQRELTHGLQQTYCVFEKLVDEQVMLYASTRRSGSWGTAVSTEAAGSELEANFYTIDRDPEIYEPLPKAVDYTEKFTSAVDMLRIRAGAGLVYKSDLGYGLRKPTWGNIIVDNPIYVAPEPGGIMPEDMPVKQYMVMPHVHLLDAQWHLASDNLETGLAYSAKQPVVRITIGVFYKSSPLQADVRREAMASPFRVMRLAKYMDVKNVDSFLLASKKKPDKASKSALMIHDAMKFGTHVETKLPVTRRESKLNDQLNVVFAQKTAGYTPAMLPIGGCGWHFFDRSKKYGNTEGLIETDDITDPCPTLALRPLGENVGDDGFEKVKFPVFPIGPDDGGPSGAYCLEIVLTGAPLGADDYKMVRLGGEEDPNIFAQAVIGPSGPGQGMGGYVTHACYYTSTHGTYKWDPSIGETGGYVLFNFGTGRAEHFYSWPYHGSMMQKLPANYPFVRHVAASKCVAKGGPQALKHLEGEIDGPLFQKNGIIAVDASISGGALASAVKDGHLKLFAFATALAVLSCATEIVSMVAKTYHAMKGTSGKGGGKKKSTVKAEEKPRVGRKARGPGGK